MFLKVKSFIYGEEMALSLVFLLLSRLFALVDLTKWLQMVLRLCLPGLQLA